MVKLEQWGVVYDAEWDGYTPPEMRRTYLKGDVYGHHRKADGETVRTSHIVAAEGRTVTTASGTVYLLGETRAEYRAYVENELGRIIDEEQPVRFIRE